MPTGNFVVANLALFLKNNPRILKPEDVDALLGAAQSRSDRNGGWLTTQDIREFLPEAAAERFFEEVGASSEHQRLCDSVTGCNDTSGNHGNPEVSQTHPRYLGEDDPRPTLEEAPQAHADP